MTHSIAPFQTNPAAHRIRTGTQALAGWISYLLLLMALAGCRVPSARTDPPTTSCTEPDPPNASAVASPNAAFGCNQMHHGPPGPSEVESVSEYASEGRRTRRRAPRRDEVSGTSVGNQQVETERPVRLASLESDLPTDAIDPLTLDDAIAVSLDRNPTLIALRASEPVAHAAYHVAETYPWNPQFQLQVAPYSRDRDGNDGAVSQQYVVVQTFEMGGQRRYRRGAAAASWEQTSSTVRQAELMTASQTTRLYFTAIYQRELRDLSQSLAALNEQMVGVMQRRQNAGQANSADVELARLQARSSRRQQHLAETGYQTALINLRNQLNLDANAALEPVGNWLAWQWRPVEEVIASARSEAGLPDSGRLFESDEIADVTLRQLVVDRPDVAAARAAVAMASANVGLANAQRRPHLQFGPLWQRDDSPVEFWGFQGQIDIPVVDTGKPLVAQRRAEYRQQEITAVQLENQAVLEARAAIQRYERARRLVEQSQDEFVRKVSDDLEPFEDQFKAGQITLLEVFAARSALQQSRQSLFDLLNEVAQAAADVTQATGVPPTALFVVDTEILREPAMLPKP